MRAVTTHRGIGYLDGEDVVLLDSPWPDLGALLDTGSGLEPLADLPVRERVPLTAVTLCAPVPAPSKVWILGYAYRSHVAETARAGQPDVGPQVALLAPSAVTGPYSPVTIPALAPSHVDFEGELAVIIGRRARHVCESDAWDHVAGVAVTNDVTARDLQKGHRPGWPANASMAKSFDSFLPVGPALTSPDELPDRDDLLLRTWVDGELRQSARTSDLIYSVPFLISHLSQVTTLNPGDVICTGTPSGTGNPEGRYLAPGSRVRVEVEGVGFIENEFRAEVTSDQPGRRESVQGGRT